MTTLALTVADRCDRCSAQAYVLVSVFVADSRHHELAFCAHHYQQHEPQLMLAGAQVLLDQRRELSTSDVADRVRQAMSDLNSLAVDLDPPTRTL